MTKKTVQFKLSVAGETPAAAAAASPEAWIGAADPAPEAPRPDEPRQESPRREEPRREEAREEASRPGAFADAVAALAAGVQDSLRAGASFDRGPAADALERVMRARTPAELTAAQGDLARASMEQGLLQVSRASRIWADAVAKAAQRLGKVGE
jgi:hypothetical protein